MSFLSESTEISTEEYKDALINYYQDEEFVNTILTSEMMAFRMSGGSEIKTEKSDNGNLIIRWIDTQDTIYFLGIITKSGRLKPSDMSDIRDWINYFVEEISSGKNLMTSPNELSKKILDKVITRLEKNGVNLNIQSSGVIASRFDNNQGRTMNWKSVIVSPII